MLIMLSQIEIEIIDIGVAIKIDEAASASERLYIVANI